MNIYKCNLCGLKTPCYKLQDEHMDRPRVCTQQKIPMRSTPSLKASWELIQKIEVL